MESSRPAKVLRPVREDAPRSRTRSTLLGWLFGAACLLTVAWLVGPRAHSWARARPVYAFDPARVGLNGASPEWLEPSWARAFFASYREAVPEPFSLLDEVALGSYLSRVRALPWVAELRCTPILPDRLDLSVALRRPVALACGGGDEVWLFDAEGVCFPLHCSANHGDPAVAAAARLGLAVPAPDAALPAVPFDLPVLVGGGPAALASGAKVAALVRDEVLPRVRMLLRGVAPVPPIWGVDVSNAGYARSAAESEFQLIAAAEGGRPVALAWGHAPDHELRIIPWEDKAAVFALVLREHPGLAGLARADLRFGNTWRERLVRAEARQDG